MKFVFYFLFAVPLVLWALGGFRMHEFLRELPKLIIWYLVVGGLYLLIV
jgi:hypothetical protein